MPPHTKSYKNCLVAFFTHRDTIQYDKDHDFDNATLSAITPEEIAEYLCYKSFGTSHPTDDDIPTSCRSTTLHFYKKSISYFIPNKHQQWDVDARRGNPTKSPQVNGIINRVKKSEVRAEGVPPQARRELTESEFRCIIRIAEKYCDVVAIQLRLPTVAKFQLHLIARIDDTAHVRIADIRVHPHHDFALTVRLRWTKNCMEERDAPDQIMLGAHDSDFCVIVALGIYLQYVLEFTNAANSEYLFCDTEESPSSVKQQISTLLRKKVIDSSEWNELQEMTHGRGGNFTTGLCGTHSLRKFAATHLHDYLAEDKMKLTVVEDGEIQEECRIDIPAPTCLLLMLL
jgi:hypothetical protein